MSQGSFYNMNWNMYSMYLLELNVISVKGSLCFEFRTDFLCLTFLFSGLKSSFLPMCYILWSDISNTQ